MFKRSVVLFPYGPADGEVLTSTGRRCAAQTFCRDSAQACCQHHPAAFVLNKTHQLNDFFPRLREQEGVLLSPQTQLVVLLTTSSPINAVLNAYRRLSGAYKVLERAMWIVYVGEFVDQFQVTARRCGRLHGPMDQFPSWEATDYGSFLLLTPDLIDARLLKVAAAPYWRNGSVLRMPAVRPSSASSSSFPAVLPASFRDPDDGKNS